MVLTIQELIKKAVSDLLEPYKEKNKDKRFDFETVDFQCSDNIYQVEVKGYYQSEYRPKEQTPFVLLRLLVNYECKQVLISNIFLPEFMRYNGIGKKIIYNIFTILEKEDYTLFLVDMVSSFYSKMIKRGAIPCEECDDAVRIVKETRLIEMQDKAMSTN